MSSDEEPLDPFYVNFQRRLDGLEELRLPQQHNSAKEEERAFNNMEMETDMDWETVNKPGPQVRAHWECECLFD
jgi:hypothetical protein